MIRFIVLMLPKPLPSIPDFSCIHLLTCSRFYKICVYDMMWMSDFLQLIFLLQKKTAAPTGGQILPGSHSPRAPAAPLLHGSLQLTPGMDPKGMSQTLVPWVKNGPFLAKRVSLYSLVQLRG